MLLKQTVNGSSPLHKFLPFFGSQHAKSKFFPVYVPLTFSNNCRDKVKLSVHKDGPQVYQRICCQGVACQKVPPQRHALKPF